MKKLALLTCSLLILTGCSDPTATSETPTASPSATASPAEVEAIPEEQEPELFLPIPPALEEPVTWENLTERLDELPEILFNDVKLTVERNKALADYKVDYQVYRGPNLPDKNYAELDSWLDDLFAFYGNSYKPDSEIFLIFPYEDLEWAVQQLSEPEINHPGYEDIIRGANQSPQDQGSRQNTVPDNVPGQYSGIWSLGTTLWSQGSALTLELTEKAMINHEYGHQAQQAQWYRDDLNGPGRGMTKSMPCWIMEGVPVTVELAMTHDNFEGFKKNRMGRNLYLTPPLDDPLANRTEGGRVTEKVDYDYALNYLAKSSEINTGCEQDLYYGLGYSLGYLATEALTALQGAESPMALFQWVASGMSWNEAFEGIYGISWDEAMPILAKVIEVNAVGLPR